jgi:HAMP domain-containing protein
VRPSPAPAISPPRIKQGSSLTFFNADQQANIRHSVTTCRYPCNGRYVSNYPWADGRWDSGTLGYDPIDGGTPNPVSSTPSNRVDRAEDVADGDLDRKMALTIEGQPVKGEFLRIGTTVNTMVDQLSSFADEVTRVAREVGTEGKLGGQAQVKGVSGTWRDLTDNVNYMASNLTSQVRNIADVTKAVAAGDLSKRVPVQHPKDEVGRLAVAFNKMAADVEHHALESRAVLERERVHGDGIRHERLRVTEVGRVRALVRVGLLTDDDLAAVGDVHRHWRDEVLHLRREAVRRAALDHRGAERLAAALVEDEVEVQLHLAERARGDRGAAEPVRLVRRDRHKEVPGHEDLRPEPQ